MLDFLRSFISTVRSNRKFVTIYGDQLQNFKRTDKFTAHAPYVQTKSEIKLIERMPTLEEIRVRLKLDSYKPEPQGNVHHINNFEEMAKIRQDSINGNRGILKGIHNYSGASCYQETFK